MSIVQINKTQDSFVEIKVMRLNDSTVNSIGQVNRVKNVYISFQYTLFYLFKLLTFVSESHQLSIGSYIIFF